MRLWSLPCSVVILLIVSTCGESDPDGPTPTGAKATMRREECQFPDARLTLGDAAQAGLALEVQWREPPECFTIAHGFGEVIVQDEPLRIPTGSRPSLELTSVPDSISAFVWTPDFASATPIQRSYGTELPDQTAARFGETWSLTVLPVSRQNLDLSTVTIGERVIELSAAWPEGSKRWVFRVMIEAPPVP